jgi:GTP-binding protein EngB required for normal cell division
VVVLVDLRRGPLEEEVQLLDYLCDAGIPALLVATRVDREKRSRQRTALNRIEHTAGIKVIGTSATEKKGIEELKRVIFKRCGFVQQPSGSSVSQKNKERKK